jgi:hypothetical protein
MAALCWTLVYFSIIHPAVFYMLSGALALAAIYSSYKIYFERVPENPSKPPN